MFSQGSFNPQSGQGPQAPRPPPFLQHPSALPALYHNFQQGPLLPSPQLPPHLHQPGLPMYQHSPLAPHFAARQVPPGGMPNTAQPYLHPPPTVHGSAPLSHMYSTAQEKLQHSPYMASGPLPQPPPGSHNAEMLQAPIPPRSLPPTPSQGSLYRAPLHHLPLQPGGVQGLHQIPPPPPPPSASNFSHSAQYGSPLELMDVTSQISSMAPPPPPLPASSSPPPIPPCLPPPISSSASVSMPLPASSLFLKGGSGSEIDNIGEDGLSSKSNVTSVNPPPPPKLTEEKIIQKIDELCQLIAKNGSYEDMVRKKESKNPEFNFLFGGEPGSEAAIAHDYFLWMKQQYHLASKLDGIVPTNHLAVAIEPNASADSDMEMEDDITGSEMDQAVNEPIEGPEQTTDSVSNSFDAKKQLHTLSRSTTANAATVVLSDKEFLSGPLRLGEQGSKLVSSLDDEESGRSGFGNQGKVIISAGDTEFPLPSYKESSSEPVAGVESLSRAAAAECITSDKYSGEAIKGSSPFRLLQDYASNDSSENDKDPCLEDANPETVSPLVAGSDDNLHRDTGLNLKLVSGCNSPYETEKGIGLLPESGMSHRALKFFSYSQREAKETVPTSNASGPASEQIDTKHENRSSFDEAASPKALSKEDASGCEDIESKKTQLPSNAQKVDKFGRLFREGASDSDSDDSPHAQRRHKKGRSRSQSRSRSPLGRRRNRRSPRRRRREKRSRSRSWSPRNRRSRSRSPSFRHAGDFSSSNMRRDKRQMRECFDFLQGKCYRGASCRYMHHGSEKSGGSRHHRSKQQYVQLPPSSKNYNTHDDKLSRKASFDEQETMNQDVQHNHDISFIHATKDDTTFHNKGDSISITLVDSENHREGPIKVPETKVVREKYLDDIHCVRGSFQEAMDSDQVAANSFPSKILSDASILKSHGDASKDVHPSLKDSVIQQSQLILSDPVLENADHPAQETDDSSVSDSSPNQTFETSPKKLHDAADSVHNSSQLPPFSGPNKESNTAPQMTQLKRDNNLIPQTASFQSHSAPLESFPSYMLPNQSSLFSVLPSVSLPPPPPLVRPHVPILNVGTAQTGVDLQFQQSGLPPRGDFGSQMFIPYSTVLSSNSQVGDFWHRACTALYEPHQPLLHAESGLKPLPGSNPSDSKFGGMCLLGEDRVKQLPVQGLSASDAFARSSNYPQPASLQESPAGKMQSFPVDSVPPREIPSSQIHPYLQQKQLPYDLHHSVHNSVYGVHGSRYPADLQDGNQPLHLPDFGVTRSSTHFNPYASTFEKPLSSRFSSDFFKAEKDTAYSNKHGQPSSLSHLSVDEPGVGSKKSISSPRSARGVGRVILRSGKDQYDPLFDSIEPSSNSYKKSDHMKKWETPNNSDIMLRLKGSNQPFYVEENSKKKEVGGITLATSTDNEEFGETADAEVGDVENASQSNADALANTNMGEIEIDQIKSPGKSKESRSMKLFKVCLAEFVKEVLKPSWRQGNMSKETFKTVVKKTVDKVSGAMESHHIPKSKAKINQYIDSSQRKLTKLVMGYVDKYAKG